MVGASACRRVVTVTRMQTLPDYQEQQIVDTLTEIGCSDSHWSGAGATAEFARLRGRAFVDASVRLPNLLELGYGLLAGWGCTGGCDGAPQCVRIDDLAQHLEELKEGLQELLQFLDTAVSGVRSAVAGSGRVGKRVEQGSGDFADGRALGMTAT